MNILLLSMPDAFEHTPPVAMRFPNGALSSLAGNVDPHHHVAVADLILAQGRLAETLDRLVDEHAPDLVGLSVMTFQRRTAARVIARLRARRPGLRVVVGGYDPSLASDAYEAPDFGVDFIVRGEGEVTFRELVRALESSPHSRFDLIPGLSFRPDAPSGTRWIRNQNRPVDILASGHDIRPPRRSARVLRGYTLCGRQVDVVETSRGCTYDCSFCSIIEMRGRNFQTFAIARVLDDIRDAKMHGARTIFFVDDNITLDAKRFAALCTAIVEAGLHDLDYVVQGMTSAFAAHGEQLAPLMAKAGFRYVFLGIENVVADDLDFLRASAKNALRATGGRTVGNASIAAIDLLHQHGMFVVGGLIVGNPGDTRESIETNLAFARRYVDWPYIQHPTPYPGTPMTRDFEQRGLIVNRRLEEYDGTTAVVRSESLPAEEIELLRWRAERAIKARHFIPVLRHDPWFAATHGLALFRHLYRGSSWRTFVGMEDDRTAFRRYRSLRAAERNILGEPREDGAPSEPAPTTPTARWRANAEPRSLKPIGNAPSLGEPDRARPS